MRHTGKYQKLGNISSFIPDPLPPIDPPLALTPEITNLYGQASFNLGQLNEMAQRVPDQKRFIKAYVIKEALLSSAIEGIHTTLIDIFTQPLSEIAPSKETQLVLNYTQSLEVALNLLQKEGLPISSRLILAAHQALMSGGVGEKANPGNYRKQAVRVGDLVPPSAEKIPDLMNALEQYINQDSDLPTLIRIGLVHVQFETIHPFLDGNGRIGRLLIVLMLIDGDLLKTPILYPSYYFKKNHLEYYQRLDRVRTHGDFEGWIVYYLKAIAASAADAQHRAKEIESLESELKEFIQADPRLTPLQENALLVLTLLFQQPVVTISEVSRRINKAYNTASNIITQFVATGILIEDKEKKRNKMYRFDTYLKLLEKEYE